MCDTFITMKEASKTKSTRSPEFYKKFMSGSVLDIGPGDDLCVPYATPFDQAQGDANHILDYFKPQTFDCVHSSHCLEHVYDAPRCLADWWALVKPGGFLITVVPDEDLYEQGQWPSLFNYDHKSTFRLDGSSGRSPVSCNIQELTASLPGAKIISAKKYDAGYIHQKPIVRVPWVRRPFGRVWRTVINAGLADTALGHVWVRAALAAGCPIDQTRGYALAQIEVIAQKTS
jgi:SAM-dependent methyltransferase